MIQGRKTVGRSITIVMIAAAFWLAGPMAHAAGLGQLHVISPLGQPLNAEIEIVSLQPGEEEGLVARLASPDAFRDAGIEFNPALVTVRFAIERRGGRPLLRVRTTPPVNDPFLEILVELQWTTGRLVREYTVLLDPPEYRGPQAIAAAPAARATPAAAPEPTPVEAPGGRREAEGKIEPKPEAPAAAPQDQVRLSKAEPSKPAAPASRAAREDDAVARERALKEAQSRVTDLEKNVTDLQKLLEMKNQQLAELEKKAQGTPAPAVPAPAAPRPVAEAPKPVAEAPKPPVVAPKPVPQAPKPPVQAAKPRPKPTPPPPEPSIVDEFLDNPIALAGLGGVVVLLAGYGAWTWRKKKTTQARFQDSVLGAASTTGSSTGTGAALAAQSVSQGSLSQPLAGMEADEVDPIAEADVYMAYGRDAQAEEILKEALQKDAKRTAVHSKLLEIYANRRDVTAFEQTALKLKSLTNGSGPEWDRAAALGRPSEPQK